MSTNDVEYVLAEYFRDFVVSELATEMEATQCQLDNAERQIAFLDKVKVVKWGTHNVYAETSRATAECIDSNSCDDYLHYRFGDEPKRVCRLEELQQTVVQVAGIQVLSVLADRSTAELMVNENDQENQHGPKCIRFRFQNVGELVLAVHGWPLEQWQLFLEQATRPYFLETLPFYLSHRVAREAPQGKTVAFVELKLLKTILQL